MTDIDQNIEKDGNLNNTAANMGFPQFGHDQETSASARYQSLAMGVDRLLIRLRSLLRS